MNDESEISCATWCEILGVFGCLALTAIILVWPLKNGNRVGGRPDSDFEFVETTNGITSYRYSWTQHRTISATNGYWRLKQTKPKE